jgi:hypothetical protein
MAATLMNYSKRNGETASAEDGVQALQNISLTYCRPNIEWGGSRRGGEGFPGLVNNRRQERHVAHGMVTTTNQKILHARIDIEFRVPLRGILTDANAVVL